jgi:excisionase family DNA binding protein
MEQTMQTDPDVSRNAAHHEQLLEGIMDTARRLKVGRSTVYGLLKTGELKGVKIGRSHRVVIASAVEFVERLQAAAA